MPQVKPTAWAGQSTAGWASGQGRRKRARPRSSQSSPASLLSPAARRSATPSAVMVSAGGFCELGNAALCTLPTPHLSVLGFWPPWIWPAPLSFIARCWLGWDWSQVLVLTQPLLSTQPGGSWAAAAQIFLRALGSKVGNRVLTGRGSLACRSLLCTLNSAAARPPCSGAG